MQAFRDWKTGVNLIQNQYLPGLLMSCPRLFKATRPGNCIKRKTMKKSGTF